MNIAQFDLRQKQVQRFELHDSLEYPFLHVSEGEHISIVRCWRSHLCNWLRLQTGHTNESIDFRVLKILRFPTHQHVVVCPARHWHPRRKIEHGTALAIVGKNELRRISETECKSLSQSLMLQSSYTVDADPQAKQISDMQLQRAFGTFADWNPVVDAPALGLTPDLYLGERLLNEGDKVSVRVELSEGIRFVKAQAAQYVQRWQISAQLFYTGNTYVALSLPADLAEEVEKPPVVLAGWDPGTSQLTAVNGEQFQQLSALYMDACENPTRVDTASHQQTP